MVKFSIVIPVYNVAPYLRDCLDSVLAQTYDNWESICVDDGSTDDSGEILDEYAEKDARFKVFHQSNAGVAAARNKGIQESIGDYLTFVDPDDVIRAQMLEWMASDLREGHSVDIFAIDNIQYRDGDTIAWREWCGEKEEVDVSKFIPAKVAGMCVCGVLYKKKIIPKHGFRPFSRGEDLLFVDECCCSSQRVVISGRAVYAYRQRQGSAMHSPMTMRKLRDRIGYSQERVASLKSSGKRIDPRIYRGIGLNLTEGMVTAIGHLPRKDKPEVWQLWYQNLQWMRLQSVFPAWTMVVVWCCSVIRLHSLAWLLCALPRLLKLKGLHR